jgi:hypothetical protein
MARRMWCAVGPRGHRGGRAGAGDESVLIEASHNRMVSFDRLRIKDRADFLSGLVFIGLGLLGLAEALQYDMGDARRMGAGFFPVVLSALLMMLGMATALTSVGWRSREEVAAAQAAPTDEDDADEEDGQPWQAVRAVGFVVAALALFAVSLSRIGLVLAVVLLVFVSSFADRTLRWRETAIIAAIMAFIAVAVFRWGIGLPLPTWPRL